MLRRFYICKGFFMDIVQKLISWKRLSLRDFPMRGIPLIAFWLREASLP